MGTMRVELHATQGHRDSDRCLDFTSRIRLILYRRYDPATALEEVSNDQGIGCFMSICHTTTNLILLQNVSKIEVYCSIYMIHH